MPHLFTIPPGYLVPDVAAAHILATLSPEARGRAVVFVPTRRAVVSLREAFARALKGASSLLPRIMPLAEMDTAILTLLGAQGVALLADVPPAMGEGEQRYLLAAQVAAFLRAQHYASSMRDVLALADGLVALDAECARAGVVLRDEQLRALVRADMAAHWEQSLTFLRILSQHWPVIEASLGKTTRAKRELQLLGQLAAHWRDAPPEFPVYVVGSTASQDATAALLEVVAHLPQGGVMLPGVDGAMSPEQWARVEAGHPLYHVKAFLARFGEDFAEVLAQTVQLPLTRGDARSSVWLQALAATEEMPHWQEQPLAEYGHVRLVACPSVEKEALVIALLLRETLETPGKRAGLVTPDEGLMARVAEHLATFGIKPERLAQGTLGDGAMGSLWRGLIDLARAPGRMLPLRSLLHHPLAVVDTEFLNAMEPSWYGATHRKSGQLPPMSDALRTHPAYGALAEWVRAFADGLRQSQLASGWRTQCAAWLAALTQGAAEDAALNAALDGVAEADVLGPMGMRDFVGLVEEILAQPQREAARATHPQLLLLTPVEARMTPLDRVILGGMVDDLWPGRASADAWLNLAAKAALGLPSPAHHASLMAHDLLMLGSGAELFLTYPTRDGGSPTTRSRFIERLVTLLATHGIAESALAAPEYLAWAEALYAADSFAPSLPPEPIPSIAERPAKLSISAVDRVFSDPFSIYVEYVLRLRSLKGIDAEAEASDFGSLTHRAIHALTLHWETTKRPATEAEQAAMADHALAAFAHHPSAALFWRMRLLSALGFVNDLEATRRAERPHQVQAEMDVAAAISGVTLQGRIDRIERSDAGLVVADYKTGTIPAKSKILDGYATQLLAYALVVEAQTGHLPERLEYWKLPHGRDPGALLPVEMADLLARDLPSTLRAGLAMMRAETTPFLVGAQTHSADYDGISRYDEWAE